MTGSKSLVLIIALTASSADAWPWSTGTTQQTCSWSAGTYTDIYGTGMDHGTSQYSLAACQNHCQATSGCQAAQFSSTQRYNGKNCFIYNNKDNHNPMSPAINQFLMYLCTRNVQPHCSGDWCGPYLKDIWGTGLDGGSSQWSLDACKAHCRQNGQCKTAQYSDDQTYNGLNCFIYNTHTANENQLKNFKLWKYQGHDASWSNGERADIGGVGLGGSWAGSLQACKDRCKATSTCQAAQYSSTQQFQGYNCFIYNSKTPNAPQFMNFLFYKYDRNGSGCTGWFCSRRLSEDDKWTEVSQESSIVNV